MSRAVLLVTDGSMDRHAARGHVERPERLPAVARGVREAAGAGLEERSTRVVDETLLALVHSADHLASLEEVERGGGGWLDPDTYLVPGSLDAARHAAGGAVEAALAVAHGEAEIAFAAVRPPGHHAAAGRAAGFCLLNNVAVAVAALRRDAGLRRVGIVDWDVHHGDGTQDIFAADPDVWYGSTHQMPLYPGTGERAATGAGEAAGTMQNLPLLPGSGEPAFVEAWLGDLLPALEAFGPEAIVVSAGYDAHRDDPLAHLQVTEMGYEAVAVSLGAVTTRLHLPGVALVLEGGYDPPALRASAAATVRGLLAGRAGRER